MINSAYELNAVIPNIELLFFQMFVSPIKTKKERKGNDGDDLLTGNLFHELPGFKMPEQAYGSLLQSVALNPKKKHYKKILQFLVLHEKPAEVTSEPIYMITFIGIDQKFPFLLGSTMKYLLQNGYKVKPSTFQ